MPLSAEILAKYGDKVGRELFIETGSFEGDGIQAALDAGFKEVIGIEHATRLAGFCAARFAKDARVTIFHGDSILALPQLLSQLANRRALVCLDAHFNTALAAGAGLPCPLLAELAAVAGVAAAGHGRHVILADRVHLFETQFGTTVAEVGAALAKCVAGAQVACDGNVMVAVPAAGGPSDTSMEDASSSSVPVARHVSKRPRRGAARM